MFSPKPFVSVFAVEHEMELFRTRTSDSSGSACVLNIVGKSRPTGAPAGIFLRHNTALRWCGPGGDWMAERRHAVRFTTNIDALVFCQALDVRGVLVGFDAGGREIYRLNVDKIVEAMVGDPRVRSFLQTLQ